MNNLQEPRHFNKVRHLAMVVLLIASYRLSIVNSLFAQAQVNYQQDYKNAKLLYQEGKYNLAMEGFKKIIPYDKTNPFSEYASFYYALAAYKQKYYSVSKDMLLQIKSLYPSWEKTEEINYWLALNYFETGDSFQALKLLSSIKDRKLAEDVAKAKKHFISKMADSETLRMMLEEYPDDESIGKSLALALSKNVSSEQDRNELDEVINRFNLKRSDFIVEAPASYFKDTYSVSVLFPFVVNTLEPTAAKKRNQFVIDLYQGIELAADTLNKQGVSISLRAYDTERSQEKIKSILATEELKNTDLIIGPAWREDNLLIQEFSKANKINAFNPLTNDFDMIRDNPFGFLIQPSYEVLGQKTAQYLATDPVNSKKKCIVFYGSSVRDSVLAWNFIAKAEEAGIKIILKQEVFREESNKITEVLATPTEYDEWKAPSQFTIPKDSIGAIFVASDDVVIYTKVVSSVETRKDNTLILGSETWLESGSIDLAKFQQMNMVLYAPNHIASKQNYNEFNQHFIRDHKRTPNSLSANYSRLGYEMMLMLGRALKQYGVYIQEGFKKDIQPGYISEGFDFRSTNYNQIVPFVKFDRGFLKVVHK
jgi:ABC-type branched-subunit amino acid transport system substrate-binding protein